MSIYYEPKTDKPVELGDCIVIDEYGRLISEINKDKNLTSQEKQFLNLIASRFIEFKYEKIADLYSVSRAEFRGWLEKLRCVIVDRDSAIKNGYFKYLTDYNELLKEVVSNET